MKHTARNNVYTRLTDSLDVNLDTASKLALIWLGLLAMVIAAKLGQFVLAPLSLAIIVGLMLVPLSNKVEALGVPSGISAFMMLLLLICILGVALTVLALPLSTWADRIPIIWHKLNILVTSWQDSLMAVGSLREILQEFAISEENLKLELGDAETVKNAAYLAPAFLGQFVFFLISVYFFIATRRSIHKAFFFACLDGPKRLKLSRVLRDIESNVARYLFQITCVNIIMGVVVAGTMWFLGLPSPILWGALAAILNYLIYIGPMIMILILLLVGLSIGGTAGTIFLPAILFLIINIIEANVVTPHFIGKNMVLNPFIIFLSLAFWIWLWGPVGGFIAVPLLLALYTIFKHFYADGYKRKAR